MTSGRALTVEVFTSAYKPIPHGGVVGWNAGRQATWPATTATLISGPEHAVLVDALLTTNEGEDLARWVPTVTDRELALIYITHGHGDHFFGAGPLLRKFPAARMVSRPEVVEDARLQIAPSSMATWSTWFAGQFDTAPAVPLLLESDTIDLDGHPLRFLVVGDADGVTGSVVQIPELDLVVGGDLVYNGVHMWLWGSTSTSRATWLASIDELESLNPTTVIAGHRDPAASDDDAHRLFDQSRRYLQDFDQAVNSAEKAGDIVNVMMAKYADFGNPYTLYAAAMTQFPS